MPLAALALKSGGDLFRRYRKETDAADRALIKFGSTAALTLPLVDNLARAVGRSAAAMADLHRGARALDVSASDLYSFAKAAEVVAGVDLRPQLRRPRDVRGKGRRGVRRHRLGDRQNLR